MADITQRLGFDASQAVSQINSMTTALAGLNTQLRAFNKAAGASNQSKVVQGFAQVQANANKATTAVKATGVALQQTGKKGAQSINTVTFAMSGLLKALAARTAVQALTNLIGALGEAADAAADFSIEIARIANIARGPAGTIEALSVSLGDLSVSLGRASSEVNEAAFEALQNDLGSTEETMRLLEGAANNLALVTGGTLTQAVNSISSVIKSFNIDISQSDQVADTFFQAIDSGRITLEEFQSSLGRVAPLAGNLNVTFEETAASIAAITQAGTTARVAQTQLRNVLQKMIDPTDKLKEAFRELGAESGKELIETTGGLIPALKALGTVAEVGSQEFADMFGTIRGNLGALNLLANNSAIVDDIFGKMAESGGRAAEAAAAIDATSGRESQRSFAELGRTMRELGESTLELQTFMVDTFNNIVQSGSGATAALVSFGAAFAAAAVAAKVAGIAFLAAFPAVAVIAAAAAAAALLGDAIGNLVSSYGQAADAARELRNENAALLEEDFGKAMVEATRTAEIETKEQLDLVKQFTAGASDAYRELVSDAADSFGAIRKDWKSTATDMGKAFGDVADSIDEEILGLVDTAKKFGDSAIDAARNLEAFKFENSLKGLTDLQKGQKLLNRATQEYNRLREAALAVGADKQSQQNLRDAEKAAIAAAKAVETFSDSEKGVGVSTAKAAQVVEKALLGVVKARATAENNLLQLSVKNDNERVANAKAGLKELERVSQQLSLVDPKSLESQELKQKFKDLLDNVDVGLLGDLGLKDELDAAVREFGNKMNALEVEWQGAVNSLQDALNSRVFTAQVSLLAAGIGDAGVDEQLAQAAAAGDVGKALQEQVKILNEYKTAQQVSTIEAEKQARLAAEYEAAVRSGIEAATTTASDANRSTALQTQLDLVKQIAAEANVVNDQTETGLTARIAEVKAASLALLNAGRISTEAANGLSLALDSAQKQIDARIAANAADDFLSEESLTRAEEGLQRINDAAETNDLKTIGTESAKGMSEAAGAATRMGSALEEAQGSAKGTKDETASIGGTAAAQVAGVNQLTAAYAALEAQANAAASAQESSNSAGTAYHGGKVKYRAAGGLMTRGQDKQLTALSPGEMVINSRSTGQFFSQLQAMNSGQTPQYRDKGGSVTNVGDINVNVSNSNPASSTSVGRSIASEIRRELRRGTSTL